MLARNSKEVWNGTESFECEAFVDIAFDFYGKRIAMLKPENKIEIWDSSLEILKENSPPRMNWKPTFDLEFTYGVVNQVVWAHPKVGQLIAVSSADEKHIVIYKEKSGVINEETDFLAYLGDNPLLKWNLVGVINLPFFAPLHMSFAPIEMGFILSIVSGDKKVLFYSPIDREFENWEMIDCAECTLACSKIIWNPSFKEKIPKHRLYTSLHRPAPVTKRANSKARLTKLDIELSKLPFVPEESDQYIIMPHEPMFAVISINEDDPTLNKIIIFKYSKLAKHWLELVLDFKINGAIHDLSFAPRLSRPHDTIAIAVDSTVLIYNLFLIMDKNRNINPKICLTSTLGDKSSIKVTKVGWDHFASILFVAQSDGIINSWRRNVKGNFLNTASVLTC